MSEAKPKAQSERHTETVVNIEPSEVQVRMGESGQVELVLADGTVHEGVKVIPAFPISRPNQFVHFQDKDGKELGVLVDPRGLDRESREVLLAQADQAYFMPRITRIVRVEERMGTGIARWEVETDRGWNRFDVVSRSESVWFVGKDRIVIRDADGNRYLIEDLSAMDRRTRRLADLYI